jgi:ribosomal protein S12 methylthiotransferase
MSSDTEDSSRASGRRVFLETLGCEKNLVDSESALGLLLDQGFEVVDTVEDAELIVLNTCGFLESARQETLERLHELADDKGDAKLVAIGCMVQGGTHDLQREVPAVDHVLGVGQYHRLADLAGGASAPPLESPDLAPYAGYGARRLLTPSHVAHMKIAEGCNQSCSFCKIPALRGRQRSRSVPELLAEAHQLVAQGVRELILISQNSSAYGIDLPGQPRLGDLCRSLSTIDDLRWIRIMYAYPPMFTTKLLEDVYSQAKVVSYLDIPVQHASASVLERMDRGYDREQFRDKVERLRAIRPEVMIRTTALLGFPGETEDDVVELLDFLDDVGFDHVGTFVYSHEEQTTAGEWADDVDPSEKEDRRARVESLQWEIGQSLKESRLGRTVDLVVDRVMDSAAEAELEGVPFEAGEDLELPARSAPVAFARSEGFCYEIDGGVWLAGSGLSAGDFCRARLVGCGPFDFIAERE